MKNELKTQKTKKSERKRGELFTPADFDAHASHRLSPKHSNGKGFSKEQSNQPLKQGASMDGLTTLKAQQATISVRYTDVALQLRALEAQERELSAAFRLVADQVKLAEEAEKKQSGHSLPAALNTETP